MSTGVTRDLQKTLPLDDGWDVIVFGGGPAGCAAATAAAREGARTLLVEATGTLGGLGTSGLVPAWCPFSDGEKIIYRGLAEKVFRAATAALPHVDADWVDWVPIHPEALKRVYDDLVADAGVTVVFQTALAAVDAADGRVAAAYVADKSGLRALSARVYVDATGDGDLAAWAGAEFHQGDEAGRTQSATLCFMLSGVNEYHYRHGEPLHAGNPASPIHAALASGRYPLIDAHLCNTLLGPGTVGFNASHIPGVDGTRPEDLSGGLMRGRRIAAQLHAALREMNPAAFAGSFLAQTAPLLGIRETRRIVGRYTLTVADYAARRSFDDEIARNCYYIDVHRNPGESDDVRERESLHLEKGESHGIPYRCLQPKGLANALVAGRCISTDRPVQGSTRVMPVCLVTGEAAGTAAAMAARGADGDTDSVDTAALRERLREHGAYLP